MAFRPIHAVDKAHRLRVCQAFWPDAHHPDKIELERFFAEAPKHFRPYR